MCSFTSSWKNCHYNWADVIDEGLPRETGPGLVRWSSWYDPACCWILRRNDLEFNLIIFLFFLNPSFTFWEEQVALHLEKTWLCRTRVESYFESTMKWPLLSRKENTFKITSARELKFNPYSIWHEIMKIWTKLVTLKRKTKIKYFLLSLWSFFLFLFRNSPTAGRRPTARISRAVSFIQLLHRHRQGWPAVRHQASLGKRLPLRCSQSSKIIRKLNDW